jgi:hypothetical protein
MTQPFDPSVLSMPSFSSVYIPDLPSLNLSEAERGTISRLQMKAWRQRAWMQLTDSYYRGMQIIQSLGIAVPPELDGLRVIVGWPRGAAVDPFVERLAIDSYRLATGTSADDALTDVMLANGFESEQSVAFLEALVAGRAYFTVGSPDEPGGAPDVCVESPLNMAVNWDLRGRAPKEALQSYWLDGYRHAVLYLPNQTIYLAEDENATWQLADRDVHNFGMVPVIRMANRPRAADRDGSSEITPELMSIVDAACRTLQNLAVSGEFYSVPQKLILGASEEDFIGTDGTTKSAWQTYVSRVLALQRDEEGQLPDIKQFDAYDPSVFTKVIEMYASQVAGITGATPQDLGLYTQGNPISAESAQVNESRRDRRTRRMQANFSCGIVETGQMVMRFLNNGDMPAGYEKLAVDWQDPQMPNFTGYSDGVSKLAGEGIVPRRSEVTLRKLGFSAVDRRRMEAEWLLDANKGDDLLAQIGQSVEGKTIRSVNALSSIADKAAAPAAPATPPAPGT